MITIVSFFSATYILMTILVTVILYSLYFIKGIIPRTIFLIMGILIIPFTYVLLTHVLGNPRPIINHFSLSKETYILKDFYLVENEGIYLWLIGNNTNIPVYFSFPWDIPHASKILRANANVEANGKIEVTIEGIKNLTDPGKYNTDGRIEYNIKYPPQPEPKRENQNILIIE